MLSTFIRSEQNCSQTVELLFAKTDIVTHAGLKIIIYETMVGFKLVVVCLPQLPKYWGYRCEPTLLAKQQGVN